MQVLQVRLKDLEKSGDTVTVHIKHAPAVRGKVTAVFEGEVTMLRDNAGSDEGPNAWFAAESVTLISGRAD